MKTLEELVDKWQSMDRIKRLNVLESRVKKVSSMLHDMLIYRDEEPIGSLQRRQYTEHIRRYQMKLNRLKKQIEKEGRLEQ